MHQERLPRIVLSHMLQYGGKCVQEWINLGTECDFALSISQNETSTITKQKFYTLLNKLGHKFYDKFVNEGRSSPATRALKRNA